MRLISVEGTSIKVLLEDDRERTFHFPNAAELSLALREWINQEPGLKDFLSRSGIDRAISPKEHEDGQKSGL